MSTYEFAERETNCPSSMISELPSVLDHRLRDASETRVPLPDARRQELDHKRRHVARVAHALDQLAILGADPAGPFFRNAALMVAYGEAAIAAEEREIGQLTGLRARAYELAELSTLPHLLDCQYHKLWVQGLADTTLSSVREHHLAGFRAAYSRLAPLMDLQNVPFETQVRIQCGMTLAGLDADG
jgi:hypothetical protein